MSCPVRPIDVAGRLEAGPAQGHLASFLSAGSLDATWGGGTCHKPTIIALVQVRRDLERDLADWPWPSGREHVFTAVAAQLCLRLGQQVYLDVIRGVPICPGHERLLTIASTALYFCLCQQEIWA